MSIETDIVENDCKPRRNRFLIKAKSEKNSCGRTFFDRRRSSRVHWRPKFGLQSVVWDEALNIRGGYPDYHHRDLRSSINEGQFSRVGILQFNLFDEGVSTRATAATVAINDPLGQELGSQRILRTSPLTPVRTIC